MNGGAQGPDLGRVVVVGVGVGITTLQTRLRRCVGDGEQKKRAWHQKLQLGTVRGAREDGGNGGGGAPPPSMSAAGGDRFIFFY